MPLSKPRHLFGVNNILFFQLADRKPFGPIITVLASSGVEMESDFEVLTGGAEKFELAAEPTVISTEVTFTTKDYRDYLFEIFTGATVTSTTAETTGNVGTSTNVKGTTVIEATDGIASIAALSGSEANLKFGKLVIEATGSDSINVLYSSNIDFKRGAAISYQNDELEVLAADVTVPPLGATVDIVSLGLQITGGSAATVVFAVGDTAQLAVRPINDRSSVIQIGDSNTEFVEFGAILYSQKRTTGEMFEVEIFKAVGAGFPIGMEEKTFAEAELTIKALKDFDTDLLMEIRHTAP